MQSIYTRSSAVRVWLGPASDAIPAADIDQAVRHIELLSNRSDLTRDVLIDPRVWEACLRFLVGLFAAPYWQRTWTVQESLLPSYFYVHFGKRNHIMSLQTIFGLAVHLIETPMPLISPSPRDTVQDLLTRTISGADDIGMRYELYRRRLLHNENEEESGVDDPGRRQEDYLERMRDFCSFVNVCIPLEATDPRDKVYGLLGMAPKQFADAIEPDYSAPISSVYARYTSQAVTHTASVLPLFDSWIVLKRAGLPSWVPDLARPGRRFGSLPFLGLAWESFRATPEPCIGSRLLNYFVLCVPAVIVDTMTRTIRRGNDQRPVPGCIKLKNDPINTLRRIMGYWVSFARYVAGGSVQSALFCTLNCGKQFVLRNGNGGGNRSFHDISSYRRRLGSWKWIQRICAGSNIEETLSNSANSIRREQCFFTTRRGYLGLSELPDTRPGDVVAILDGGNLPFILRPVEAESESEPPTDELEARMDNTYTLVEPAYVHKIMHGEMLDESSALYVESFWSKLWRWLLGGMGPDLEMKTRMQIHKRERRRIYLA